MKPLTRAQMRRAAMGNLKPGWIEVSLVRAEVGYCLAVNGFRVAGTKPCGRDNVLWTWTVRADLFAQQVAEAVRPAGHDGEA
jgi:hypothetical protein